eukprot:1308980-Prymnesium_polylepis.1
MLLKDASVTRRKLGMKLLQRAAAVYLPPRVASWRYARGSRVLLAGLSGAAGGGGMGGGGDGAQEEEGEGGGESEEDLVPEEIEEIIGQLLQGLGDSDTVVRWSAAKGIGRVTGRLPMELADDVVGSVLDLLSPGEEPN